MSWEGLKYGNLFRPFPDYSCNATETLLSADELTYHVGACAQNSRESQKVIYSSFYGYAMAICDRYTNNQDDAVEILGMNALEPFATKQRRRRQIAEQLCESRTHEFPRAIGCRLKGAEVQDCLDPKAWPLADISRQIAGLRQTQKATMQGFGAMASAAMADGALSEKHKELMATAIAVSQRCAGCIGFHVKALIRLGTTRAEFEEMLGVAVYMGGGPSLMYCAEALQAWEQFAPASVAST